MNRRELFKALAGTAAAAAGMLGMKAIERQRYGAVTVDRHRALCARGVHLHVFHRGRDITNDCVFADDTGDGFASVLLKDARGSHYYDPQRDEIAKRVVRGITLREGAPFA